MHTKHTFVFLKLLKSCLKFNRKTIRCRIYYRIFLTIYFWVLYIFLLGTTRCSYIKVSSKKYFFWSSRLNIKKYIYHAQSTAFLQINPARAIDKKNVHWNPYDWLHSMLRNWNSSAIFEWKTWKIKAPAWSKEEWRNGSRRKNPFF